MASSFDKAFDFTVMSEGGYVNDPNDYGGETMVGISRVYWPNWTGWLTVDTMRSNDDFPNCLYKDEDLDKEIRDFYRTNFWAPVKGNELAKGSEEIAAEVFDCAVNMGKKRAIKFLQTSLNILNRNERLYEELVVDGITGPGTNGAYTAFIKVDSATMLLKALLVQRGAYYSKRAIDDPTQEKFIRGWLNRLVIDKV